MKRPKYNLSYCTRDLIQGWRQEFSDGGLTLSPRGLKYGFQGIINIIQGIIFKVFSKISDKIAFHLPMGTSMLRWGSHSLPSTPLAPPLIYSTLIFKFSIVLFYSFILNHIYITKYIYNSREFVLVTASSTCTNFFVLVTSSFTYVNISAIW